MVDDELTSSSGTAENPTLPLSLPAQNSDRIGAYKLLQKIGEGGMGVVYLAEQDKPIRRRVAVKVIKLGMDTKQVIARFEAERQALAIMNHPTVAKIFDAGITLGGRPYFAMEFVKGIPISEHCDANRLSTKERLNLFIKICDGILHAHQKGIIHRDIKPTNILVSIEDGKASPKIIDFGIAKATDQRLTEQTLFTQTGTMVGTPEYMSPEQANLTGQDVDTRTDIYSLGVLLYEILTGVLPFESKRLRSVGLMEIQRIIRDEEPSKPSMRLSEMSIGQDAARFQRTDTRTLQRRLKGDLDWITMKALEKDRTRRYGSAAELAADIQRHIDHLPVTASPPSIRYRVIKFVRRHHFLVAAVCMVVTALLLGVAGTTTGLLRAVQARQDAEEQRVLAEHETKRVNALNAFLQQVLGAADPEKDGREVRVIEILERAAIKIPVEFYGQPELAVAMRGVIGQTFQNLGLLDESDTQLTKAHEIAMKNLGETHPETILVKSRLASLRIDQGRFDEATQLFEEVRGQLEAQPESLARERISVANDFAYLLRARGFLDAAEELYRTTLPQAIHHLGEDDLVVLRLQDNLGVVLYEKQEWGKAELLNRGSMEALEHTVGKDHPATITAMQNLAAVLQAQGRFDEAEDTFREALIHQTTILGPSHPAVADIMNNLGTLLQVMEAFTEAEKLIRGALAINEKILGEMNPSTLISANNLGSILQTQGKLNQAKPYFQRAIEGNELHFGHNHHETLTARNNLATLLEEMGENAEAERIYRQVAETRIQVLGLLNIETIISMNNLSACLIDQHQYTEAENWIRRAVASAKEGLPQDHYMTGIMLTRHGSCLTALKQFKEAETSLMEGHTILNAALGPEHSRTQWATRCIKELDQARNPSKE